MEARLFAIIIPT